MTDAEIEAHCLTLPGTETVIQWMGSHVFKIGGKVYAILAPEMDRVSVKCADAETAAFLIEIGAATRAPHLPRGGWVAFERGAPDLGARIDTSYRTVRASLTKAAQATLPPVA